MTSVLRFSRLANSLTPLARKVSASAGVALLFCWCVPNPAKSAAGDLDLTFGNAGLVTTSFAGVDRAFAIAIQRDGKLVAVGVSNQFGGGAFAVARYNSNGSLDSSFGTLGKVTTNFRVFGDEAHAIAIQRDGKIIVAGSTGTDVNGPRDFALARYDSDGSLDSTFGTAGKVTTDFLGSYDDANSIAIQSDGKIVVGGDAFGDHIFFALARYNTDGSLDTSFGTAGKVITDFRGHLDQALIYSILIQNDGKIVAAGRADDISSNFGLARYNSDGTLDLTFGSGGKVTTDFSGINDEAHGLAIQHDGKLVVAGTANSDGPQPNPDFAIVRYNSDGSLDNSFGSGGKVLTDFGSSFDAANAIAIQSDQQIVVAGRAGLGFALARYSPDGNLDVSFGTQGKLTTLFTGSCGGATAFALALQDDGNIVAAGDVTCAGSFDFALARYIGTPPFDLCLQDDSSGDTLKINSNTGGYQFTKCGTGLVFSGTGNLSKKGSIITLQHYAIDRRILARIDASANKGTASIQVFSLGTTFTIADRNTINNSCACP